ncbi:mucin-2-like isoform X2 [Sphaeramia orbicularis]|uniref:mucin-2-like isoform X2 n=1 Tax=Sphaeramia orbicularis TaxID=375764 RepID=UPI00117CDDCA|nr:mucin-2-like isoform X2 [Sphaeramia orbicularis]
MMEPKLWIGFCALVLLLNVASATHDAVPTASATPETTAASGSAEAPATPAAGFVSDSSLNQTNPAADASNVTGSSTNTGPSGNSSTTTDRETSPVTTQPSKPNATDMSLPSETNGTTPKVSPSQPPVPSAESHDPSSHKLPDSATTTTTTTTHRNDTSPGGSTTTLSTNPTKHTAPLLPDSTSPSGDTTHPTTHPSTSALTPTAKTSHTKTETTVTTATTQSNTISSQKPSHTSQPDPHLTSTPNPAPSSSTQAKGHVDTPSQLNDGKDMTHKSPTLNPLLAGLVSAFIITAVIITLLLFLKLRRRDNRPEFRRLQDLPMDDMEDTPLSMYSY